MTYHGNIQSYRDRSIDPEQPILVYRNLTLKNGRWFSIKQNGRVVAHALAIGLRECTFVINEAGRKKVLESGQKNVHAFIKGYYSTTAYLNYSDYKTAITYDPYKHSTFVTKSDFKPVIGASGIVCDDTGVKAVSVEYL